MFRGVTAEGINREILTSIECAALNRKYGVLSLAIPELSLMQMARTLAPKPEENTSPPGAYRESLLAFDNYSSGFETFKNGYMPSTNVICKGIFPALQYVIKQHIYAMNVAERLKSNSKERHKRVSVVERPNAWENPVTFALDPYGNTDFFCKLCNKELSNVYLHCTGCEIILSKDFNICLECHQEKRYARPVQMHPLNNKRHSTINHIGNYTFDRVSRCPCKNGPVCRHCNYCAGCSCRCHTWFSLHFRFLKKDDELKLLHRVKRQVGREELEAADEAEKRLSMAVKGTFDDGTDTPFGLHDMDVLIDDPEAMEEMEGQEEEDNQSDSNSEGREPEAPKRKSRRLGNEEPEQIEVAPETKADAELGVASNEKAKESSSRDDSMQVDVDDMKVTIRYRTGEWTESERGSLRRALKEEADWESIVAKCPDRGSDQVRKYAMEKFPTLAKALKERGINRMEIAADAQAESATLEQEDKPTPEQEVQATRKPDNHAESVGEELDNEPTVDDDKPAVVPTADVMQSDTKPALEPTADAEQSDTKPAVEPTVDAEQSDTKPAANDEVVTPAIKVESTEPTTAPKDTKKDEEDKEKSDSEDQAKAALNDALKLVGKVQLNSGKWTAEEKDRLKAALESAVDFQGVEDIVGTRRYPQIRSYAPRTFPDLWEGFRERLKAKEESDAKDSKSVKEVPVSSDEQKLPSPDVEMTNEVEGEDMKLAARRTRRRSVEDDSKGDDAAAEKETDEVEETKPAARRTRRRSMDDDSKGDNTRNSGDEDGTDTDKDKEAVSPRPLLVAGESKLKLLARARKGQMRNASQSPGGRSRRATQDLFGGRKRRNSASSNGSAKQADPPTETHPPTEDAGDSKRQKVN